jgi:hypothetical protein
VKEKKMSRTCNKHEEERNARRILVGKPDGNRSLERPRYKSEDNINMNLRGVKWGGTD